MNSPAVLAASAGLAGLFVLRRRQHNAKKVYPARSGILFRFVDGQELDPTEDYDDQEELGEFPPLILPGAFEPELLLGCPGRHWNMMLQTFAHTLPLQMHLEPHALDGVRRDETNAPPLFRRAVRLLDSFPKLADLMQPENKDTERRGRAKFRLSGKGKFVHRNRYERRNIICCLDGAQYWLLLDTSVGATKDANDGTLNNGAADAYLEAQQNKNWNGYRSHKWSSMLSLEQMKDIARGAPPGVTAVIIKVAAGDIFTFDGRWWHATSYKEPVLSLFFTPGENMEVALEQHKKRMAMPMQEGLKVATINMAKCSRLSASWKESKKGASMMDRWAPGMDKKT